MTFSIQHIRPHRLYTTWKGGRKDYDKNLRRTWPQTLAVWLKS